MLKQLVKYTVAAVIWKRYRALIIATIVLFIYFWLVGKIHGDFIAYSKLRASSEDLGLSFVIKWFLFGVGLVCYLACVFWRTGEPASDKSQTDTQSTGVEPSPSNIDSFANVRNKKNLRSKSDIIIEKYPPKKK